MELRQPQKNPGVDKQAAGVSVSLSYGSIKSVSDGYDWLSQSIQPKWFRWPTQMDEQFESNDNRIESNRIESRRWKNWHILYAMLQTTLTEIVLDQHDAPKQIFQRVEGWLRVKLLL